ncbi:pilus assembly PilX N-terminal domain-containing protein [Tepidibacter formicigenes]|jgi:Tfp pilus assembly protein PilX/cytoskeletal protein CcmA (bactofilin family)|uniref:PilX N-terminal n=1 Tax=Tepidibacter formicigenes DSM 15518 TaxID=1123349 RepID=A0A1M6MHM6_9FIRM|nr:pilus assembly PilX N-terminal domain-containing protein [Tepidibacter formicigenes]SHJ82810.1 hypothetical protein SAMN02744037_00943 [Tepidibacter formicigenes DSM 15518]
MIRKILKSEKGSTLTMVLMTLSVLSVLGTAVMSLSIMNLKMKIIDQKSKTSFYLSEAGLEEAYAIMMNKVEEGIQKGNEEVENNLSNFIASERSKEFAEPPEIAQDSPFINSDGSVDEDNIKIKMQEWFTKGYTNYLNKEENNKNLLKKELEKLSNYSVLDKEIDTSRAIIEVENINTYAKSPMMNENENLDDFEDELNRYIESKFEIIITSEFTHNDIRKKIRSTFSIDIPKYDTPYYVGNEIIKLRENVLWSKALISEKNIVVEGNDVTINGDIYAYGDESKTNIKDRGIIVGNNNEGNLVVNGNVITGSYLQTKGNNSSITISDGDVYCNTLAVPQLQESCNITVNGNVNTYDDIELNGTQSNININGNYYGFSYGSDGHDRSSSIIVNSDDIGKTNGSSIEITGNGKEKEYYGASQEDGKGTFIAGTVYIALDNEDYQTGESISVKGNYKGYSKELNDGSKYDKSNVNFNYFSPLYLMDSINNSSDPIYKQRGEYLKAVYDSDDSILNLGNGAIDIQNIKHSLGDYIKKEDINLSLMEGNFTLDYTNAFDKNLKEYKYYVNRMGDSQINIDNILDNNDNNTNLDTRLYITDRFNFSQNFIPDTQEKKQKIIDDKEIFFVNDNSSKVFSIVGPSDGNPVERYNGDYTINLNNKELKGIIVTKGDVYISGNIEFTGAIITEGNIYIKDNNEKIFNNQYSEDLRNNNYVIKKICEDKKTKGTQIGDLFKQDDIGDKELDIVYELEANIDENINSYYRFSDIIKISSWQKLR